MVDIVDCSEALAAIEVYRRTHEELGADITPRLIAWGLTAIAKESPNLNLGTGWKGMTQKERWRRVRMNLSAEGINALHGLLKQRYGPPPKQMSLLNEGTQKNHSE